MFGVEGLGAVLPQSRKVQKVEEAEGRRVEGNAKFAEGDYLGAIAAYDETLKLNPKDGSAYANKAECYLRARVFEMALENASKAYECAASDDKSSKLKALYKKAMALNGMARYTDAEKVVDEGIALACEEADAPTRKTLEKVKLECVMLKEQAFTGAYDLGALYLNRMSASFRRCADYIGPVKVSKLTNGRRGVVTTSAVSAGELLMVQSPLSVASFGKTVEQNLVRGLYEAARAHAADWAILQALPTSSEDEEKDAPSMNVFRKHINAANKENAVPQTPEELAFLPKVVANCAISGRKLCGVWALPSFMNHSCAPNAHRINVGSIMLVFASKDLPAGSEVTIKYYDTLIPKADRDAFAKRRGYSCNCVRCAVESTGDVSEDEKKKLEAEGKDEGAGGITRAVNGLKRKFKSVLKQFKVELAEMKKTKGQTLPNVQPLLELREWFEARLAALDLDQSQLAMARMSCYSMYDTLSLALSCTGATEVKHALIKTIIGDLNVVDPGGFAACKQSTMLANNARRAFGKDSNEVVEATTAMIEAHQLRYGGIDGDDLVEIVRRTEQSIAEEGAEFCEI